LKYHGEERRTSCSTLNRQQATRKEFFAKIHKFYLKTDILNLFSINLGKIKKGPEFLISVLAEAALVRK
jgi:hypothetical protein